MKIYSLLSLFAAVTALSFLATTPARAQGSPDAGAAVGQEPGAFNGTIVDLDVAGQKITVTSAKKNGESKTFLVTPQTTLIGLDGKPIKMLNLRDSDVVSVVAGEGHTAVKVTVIGDGYEIP